MRAWRLASARFGFHPLLSAVDSENAASPVAIAFRFLTGEDAGSLQPAIEQVLETIEPETGWPVQIQTVIDAETRVNFRIPPKYCDIRDCEYTKTGDVLSHAWVLSVMSVNQPGDKLDDQALLKPESADKDDDRVIYKSAVSGWALEYRVSYDWRDRVDSGRAPYGFSMSYGPLRYTFHIGESRRVTYKRVYQSSFEITGPEDLPLLREFSDRIVGAVLSKGGLTVYIDEDSLLEAGVAHFGNAGDITGINALYDYLEKPNPYFFKGWIVWGTLASVLDDSGNETFRWQPNTEINEMIGDDQAEEIIERFGKITDGEYVDIKRKIILKDEAQIRENFQRWGISCAEII